MYNYYLAGPWFTKEEEKIHNQINSMLLNDLLVRAGDVRIINPREYKVPHGETMDNSLWGLEVFEHDKMCIKASDIVYAILHGLNMDSGTAMEVGYAYSLGKRVVGIIVNPKETYSCMIVNACETLVDLTFHTIEKENICVK